MTSKENMNGKESESFLFGIFFPGWHRVGSVGSVNGLMDGLCDSQALGSMGIF